MNAGAAVDVSVALQFVPNWKLAESASVADESSAMYATHVPSVTC